MSEIDTKGISQLLLSPLFLLDHLLGTFVPGVLLLLLLGLKGNVMLRSEWLSPLFGYKTKVAIFLLLAFVLGSILKVPFLVLAALWRLVPKRFLPAEPVALIEKYPAFDKMLKAVLSQGVVMVTPGLLDQLAVSKADAVFYLGTGCAFLIAAFVPGDGSLRWAEASIGLLMMCTGVVKSAKFREQTVGAIGIGMANVLARITPQQITLAKTIIETLRSGKTPLEASEVVPNAPPPATNA